VNTEGGESAPYHSGIINFAENKSGLEDPGVVGTEIIQFWNEIEPQEGKYDWSKIDDCLDRWGGQDKQVDIRIATVHNQPFNTPRWLYEKYHVRMVTRGWWADFEGETQDYVLFPETQRSKQPQHVISGDVSIFSETSQTARIVQLNPAIKLDSGYEYCVQFDYKLHQEGRYWVAAMSDSGGIEAEQKIVLEGSLDKQSSRVVLFKLDQFEDYEIVWGCDGAGQISLDNINIAKIDLAPPWKTENFDDTPEFIRLSERVSVLKDSEEVINGSRFLYAANQMDDLEVLLSNNSVRWPLERNKGYVVKADVKAVQDTILLFRFYRPSVKPDPNFESGLPVYEKRFKLKAGTSETIKHYMTKLLDANDYVFQICMEGTGQVAIDNLMIRTWSDRVVGFPNYFDSTFKQKWRNMVHQLALRYNSHPQIGVISVGGFGRWEEVMLDEDQPGILDEQWLAFGFNQQNYLQHIEWAMDLFKKEFPNNSLRICLAYGLKKVNDVDWIYRRTAQAAAIRGIGIKQNGLSERYSSWDDNTNASYLFNYYRNQPDIKMTFETGGQIYRDVNLVFGHPLSLINRALIDGADNIFLYGSDISARNVQKYLRYATEQMGSQLFTNFYNRLGDYSMVNEHSPNPVDYHNLWLGLRQLPSDKTNYTAVAGQRCARLDAEPIVIDLDDRQQYEGIFSAVLGIEYYDQGKDSFTVTGYNPQSRRHEALGAVQKGNTLKWKWHYFYPSFPIDSKRAYGSDIQNDLIIDSNDDGVDLIQNMEMSFVPARQWKSKKVKSVEPSNEFTRVRSGLSVDINLEDLQIVDCISIPAWSDWRGNASALGRIYRKNAAGFKLVSEKEVYMPGKKDWIDFYVPTSIGGQYRIELLNPKGEIGWYHSKTGGLAYQCFQYQRKPIAVALDQNNPSQYDFHAAVPFSGIRFNGFKSNQPFPVSLKLERIMSNGQRFLIPTSSDQGLSGDPVVNVPPMPAGQYRLTLSKPVPSDDLKIILLTLNRLREPKSSLRDSINAPIVSWKIDQTSDGWLVKGRCLSQVNESGLKVLLNGIEPEIVSPEFNLKAGSNQMIHIMLMNKTASSLVKLWWSDETTPFSPVGSVYIPVVANDTVTRDYTFPIGLEPAWKGNITRLKIQPVTGMTDAGEFVMSQIALYEKGERL
jgi:hypothetical protein